MKFERDISTPYPYVSLQDLSTVVETVVPGISKEDTSKFESSLQQLQKEYAPHVSTFYEADASMIAEELEQQVLAELQRVDKRVGVVNLDKEIGKSLLHPDIFRINISRDNDNNLVPRIGTLKSPHEQLQELASWARLGEYEEVLFIDDVLAFGDTMPVLIKNLRSFLPEMPLRLLVGIAASGGGWKGIQSVQEKTGITPEHLIRVEASEPIEDVTTGMAIPTSRDFTLLGGKVGEGPDKQQVSLPYALPFSNPIRSLVRIGEDTVFSQDVLNFNVNMFDRMSEVAKKEIVIRDLVAKGFGIPFTSLDEYRSMLRIPSLDTTVHDYLTHAKDLIEGGG